jgi:hypothetical protein
MDINGLPAHALLVHAVVVIVPLTAVAAIVVSLWPAAQRKLTFLVPLGAWVGLIAVPFTTAAGTDLAVRLGNPAFIDRHRQLGNLVLPFVIALAVTTTAQWLLLRGRDSGPAVRRWLAVLVILSAVAAVTIVALAGDAGARAVWGHLG